MSSIFDNLGIDPGIIIIILLVLTIISAGKKCKQQYEAEPLGTKI